MRQFRFDRIRQRWLTILQQEMQSWISDLMKDALDPDKIMSFIQRMGIDISQLSGLVGQQPGFDPYQVLGLNRSSTDEEVKSRYRGLMRKLHPDVAGKGTDFLVAMVNSAYQQIGEERGWR